MHKGNQKLIRLLSIVGLLLVFLSGRFSLARINLGEVQVNYVLFAIVAPFSLFAARRRGMFSIYRKFIASLVVFILYLMTSISWSQNMEIGMPKFIQLFFLLLLCLDFVFILCAFENKDELALIVAYFFIVVGIIYAIGIFRGILTGGEGLRSTVAFYQRGYNVQTRVLFMAMCSSVFLISYHRHYKYIMLSFLYLISIIFLGSKQGIIATIFILPLFCVLKLCNHLLSGKIRKMPDDKNTHFVNHENWKNTRPYRKRRKLKAFKIIVVSILIIMILLWVFRDRLERNIMFVYRHVLRSLDDPEVVNIARYNLAAMSVDLIKQNPYWGIGLDRYNDFLISYPHNISLEILLDGGAVGFILFLPLAMHALYFLVKDRKSIYLPFSMIPLYMLLVSHVSGDMYDFRYYFLWSMIALFLLSKRGIRKSPLTFNVEIANTSFRK